MRLLLEFSDYPKEQHLVGRMIMAYGEFEFEVARLLGYAINGDQDTACRIFFRVNGEAARLDVADAIVRPFFDKLRLTGQWSNALGALRYCKSVRNQYAHCNWIADVGRPLSFVNMDQDANSADGTLNVRLYPTDLALLEKQHQYFEYCSDCLYYLSCRCRKYTGQASPDPEAPKSISPPPRDNLPPKAAPTPPEGRG